MATQAETVKKLEDDGWQVVERDDGVVGAKGAIVMESPKTKNRLFVMPDGKTEAYMVRKP